MFYINSHTLLNNRVLVINKKLLRANSHLKRCPYSVYIIFALLYGIRYKCFQPMTL